MPVQWRSGRDSGRRQGPPFITPSGKARLTVAALCKPADYHIILLHWDETSGGSYPCLGEGECHLCPSRRFEGVYGPGMYVSARHGKWVQGILFLGTPDGGASQLNLCRTPTIIGRADDAPRARRIVSYGTPKLHEVPPLPTWATFDVRPFLLRRWGLFKEADLLDCELHFPEQETLSFGSVAEGGAG